LRYITNIPIDSDAEEVMSINLDIKFDMVSVDIETVSLSNTTILGIAIGLSKDIGLYFFDLRDPLLRHLVQDTPMLIFHNDAFDVPALRKLGFKIGAYADTMLKAYSAGILEKSLAELSESILHRDCPKVTDQWEKPSQGNIGINHEVMGRISIIHAINTYALWEALPMTQLYTDIDFPCVDLVIEMEGWGLLVDQSRLTDVEQQEVIKATRLKAELVAELGDINFGSPAQVTKALKAKGVIGTRKTKGGAVSSSDESLKALNSPIANKLLKWRSVKKTLSTYVPQFRDIDSNGRIHTKFGYTETGRWNSSPNLQNLTNDSKFAEEGLLEVFTLRDCLVAEEGFTFLSLDASQLELHVAATLCQDPAMLEDVTEDDLHMATAIRVFGWTDDAKEMKLRRYNAKQLNFAILYGATASKIAEMAGVTLERAEELLQMYFATYPVLYKWILATQKQAKKDGFVVNIFGRIRPIPEFKSEIWSLRAKAEREAVNTKVQGTAVDIIKLAMLYLRRELDKSVRLVLNVHDEILFEVPDAILESTIATCKEMYAAFPDYPWTLKLGKCYGKLKELK
jgi:DNA polymerase-1